MRLWILWKWFTVSSGRSTRRLIRSHPSTTINNATTRSLRGATSMSGAQYSSIGRKLSIANRRKPRSKRCWTKRTWQANWKKRCFTSSRTKRWKACIKTMSVTLCLRPKKPKMRKIALCTSKTTTSVVRSGRKQRKWSRRRTSRTKSASYRTWLKGNVSWCVIKSWRRSTKPARTTRKTCKRKFFLTAKCSRSWKNINRLSLKKIKS